MSWIKQIFTQIIVISVLLNILAFPLLWLGWKATPYSDSFNSKWERLGRSSFDYPHPYIGYTRTNKQDFSDLKNDENLVWDSFETKNFDKTYDPTILILGGSVAAHISNNQRAHANEDIPRHGRHIFSRILLSYYPDIDFRVINASYGGKKQPQQYLTAIYLDLIGLEYNLVINIDGFNEIALPITENYQQGIPGIFPRSYFHQVRAFTEGTKCIDILNNDITFLPFLDFFNYIRKRMCLVSIADIDTKTPQIFKEKKFQEYMAELPELWATSSNKLNDFLAAGKKEYIHVIQPNQYLSGSKPLSSEELEYAYKKNYRSEIVNNYYNDLRIDMLEAKNISDLRYLFKKNEATLYRDVCCHLNEEGMSIIAKEIILKNKSLFDRLLAVY